MENWTREWRELSRQAGVLSLRSEDELPRVRPPHFGGDPLQRSTVRWVSGASSGLVCASTATHHKRTFSASGWGDWSHPRHLWCSGPAARLCANWNLTQRFPPKTHVWFISQLTKWFGFFCGCAPEPGASQKSLKDSGFSLNMNECAPVLGEEPPAQTDRCSFIRVELGCTSGAFLILWRHWIIQM